MVYLGLFGLDISGGLMFVKSKSLPVYLCKVFHALVPHISNRKFNANVILIYLKL